jgi:hypothetical protein
MKIQKSDEDKRVKLFVNKYNGLNEKFGVLKYVGENGMLDVQLDQKYIINKHDDGIREVHEENVELIED